MGGVEVVEMVEMMEIVPRNKYTRHPYEGEVGHDSGHSWPFTLGWAVMTFELEY